MLLIPVDGRLDWRRPAWLTLSLLLINLLVFTLYQSGDQVHRQAALERYLVADLDRLEAPVYENYLQREINLYGRARSEDLERLREYRVNNDRESLGLQVLTDVDFAAYARDQAQLYWQDAQLNRWREARAAVNGEWQRLSAQTAGLVPGAAQLSDLFSHAFLHQNWPDLLGNLLFLTMLGWVVEATLGPGRFLLGYLLGGALSAAGYAWLQGDSLQPMVGASGAVAALMGMYLALFGRQTLRFWVCLGVYFRFFKAPALVLLPLWLLKEGYDYWAAQARLTDYLADVLGLLTGAALIWLQGRSWLQVQQAPQQDSAADLALRQEWAAALADVGRMEFARASTQFEDLRRQHPEQLVFLEQLYHLAKLQPASAYCQELTVELINEALSRGLLALAKCTYADYHQLAKDRASLGPALHHRLLFACLREGDLKEAERIFERLRHADPGTLAQEACRQLIAELDKRQQGTRARPYRQWLESLAATPAATDPMGGAGAGGRRLG